MWKLKQTIMNERNENSLGNIDRGGQSRTSKFRRTKRADESLDSIFSKVSTEDKRRYTTKQTKKILNVSVSLFFLSTVYIFDIYICLPACLSVCLCRSVYSTCRCNFICTYNSVCLSVTFDIYLLLNKFCPFIHF